MSENKCPSCSDSILKTKSEKEIGICLSCQIIKDYEYKLSQLNKVVDHLEDYVCKQDRKYETLKTTNDQYEKALREIIKGCEINEMATTRGMKVSLGFIRRVLDIARKALGGE